LRVSVNAVELMVIVVEPRWSLGWNLNGVAGHYLPEKEEDTKREVECGTFREIKVRK